MMIKLVILNYVKIYECLFDKNIKIVKDGREQILWGKSLFEFNIPQAIEAVEASSDGRDQSPLPLHEEGDELVVDKADASEEDIRQPLPLHKHPRIDILSQVKCQICNRYIEL